MNSVATSEASAHLATLLERVARGERIVITDGNRPVAMLVPADPTLQADSAVIGRQMLAYRDQVGKRLGESFRDLAHLDHRY